jgi:hypothetical protein
MRKIIAFTGPKGVGKSTIAHKLLLSPFLDTPILFSFAGPLKKMAAALLPPEAFLPKNKEDPAWGICGKSPRFIMQTLGTEWGRKLIGETIWKDAMKSAIGSHDGDAIVDDLRFENEARLLIEMGAKVYRVERPGVSYSSEHESEVPLCDSYVDGIIVNRTSEDLDAMVRVWNPTL